MILKKNILLISVFFSLITSAQTLRSLADQKGKYIGNLMRDGFFNDHQINDGKTDAVVKTEYNTIVTGNRLKMAALLRNRPEDPFNVKISDIRTINIDRFVAYADANDMRKRGHVMIWYKQIPQWLEDEAPNWTAQQVYDFTRSYILALSSYTKGKIDEWDVLNEAVLSNGFRENTWYDIVNTQENDNGEKGYIKFFANLFKWAREVNPDAALFYNDFSAEEYGNNKNNTMMAMVDDLKNIHNAPIDGVGLQSHFQLSQASQNFIDKVGQTIEALGVLGLTGNITELDFRICGEVTTEKLETQRLGYERLVKTAFSKSNCNTVLIWGVSDNDSWVDANFDGCSQATPHDYELNKKPAYFGIQKALQDFVLADKIISMNAPKVVEIGSTFSVKVNYSSSSEKDIVVLFQRDNSPFTSYESVTKTVNPGSGSFEVSLTIPNTVAIANNDYQFQVFITSVSGGWSDRYDNLTEKNISTVAQGTLSQIELDSAKALTLYPNPSKDYINVKGLKSNLIKVILYNLNGQVILKKAYTGFNDLITIDIQNFNKGIYLLKIFEDDHKISTKKIVKN